MRALMIFALPTLLAACALPDDLGPISGPSVPLVNGAGASIGAVQVEPRGRQLSPDRGGGSAAWRSRTSPACGRAMRRPCIRKRRRALEPGGATARASEPARRARRRLAQLTGSANGRGAISFLVTGGSLADAGMAPA